MDIELVIKIPEELLRYFKSFYLMNVNENKNVDKLIEAIKKGTQLPIGHGRLIDADALVDTLGASDRDIYCELVIKEDASTIIEADKEKKDESVS